MIFRSMFQKIFGQGANPQTDQARLLNTYSNSYTPWDGNAYDESTVRDLSLIHISEPTRH